MPENLVYHEYAPLPTDTMKQSNSSNIEIRLYEKEKSKQFKIDKNISQRPGTIILTTLPLRKPIHSVARRYLLACIYKHLANTIWVRDDSLTVWKQGGFEFNRFYWYLMGF